MTEPTTGRDPHAVIVAAIHADSVSLRPGHPSRIVHWPGLLATRIVNDLGLHAWTPPTPAPATVDPADLRDTIRDVINRFGFRVLLDSREHELSEVPDAFAGHLTDALTAAGWPNTYQPDNPHVTAAREAQAEVERLRAELHAQEGRLIGQLHVMEQRVIKAERDRDEARKQAADWQRQTEQALTRRKDTERQHDAERERADAGWAERAGMAERAVKLSDKLADLREGIERIADRCEHNARDGWTGMESTAKALRALLDGPTPAPSATEPPYCAECGTALDINGRIAICPDCPRMFCGIGCQRTHRALGTCPDHADGVLDDGPASPSSSPTADEPAPGQGQDTTEAQEAHHG